MELRNLKKFKLNNSVLKDFDSLMSMHLDLVEELTISEIDEKSKLLNIIGLCINVKTLIIEGDQRINTNSVILNICKPENLETLILNNVKLPTGKAVSRLNGIKLLSINNIRYNNVSKFLKALEKPENIDGLNLFNVDFGGESVSILNRFKKLKYLNLVDLNNYSLDRLDFLSKNRRLEKLNIKNAVIEPQEINKLLKGGYEKNIYLDIKTGNKTKVIDTFEVNDNMSSITINTLNLEEIIDNVQLCKVDRLILIMDTVNNITENIKRIKSVRNNISLAVTDVSFIDKEQAILLEDKLCIKQINLIDIDGILDYQNNMRLYKIKGYIKLRKEIEKLVNKVSEYSNEVERFLKLYKFIAEDIDVDDNFEEAKSDISDIKNALKEKKCVNNGYAEILQNCLACMGIESRIIKGKIKQTGEDILWNKVKLDGKWYNVNLLLDKESITNKHSLRRKVKYCLLSDNIFYITHQPDNPVEEVAEESFDKKIINVFIKTGKFNDKLFSSYLKSVAEKFLQVIKFNNVKALPAGRENNV